VTFSSISHEFAEATAPGSFHAAVIFSSTYPGTGEVTAPGSSRAAVIFWHRLDTDQTDAHGSCHIRGENRALSDDLPVTVDEYYVALAVYPAIETCYAVESKHYYALRLFVVVQQTPVLA
jgi:hypothetical protein